MQSENSILTIINDTMYNKNMKKFLLSSFIVMINLPAFADNTQDVIHRAEQILEAARITCSGISDEIAKVANISKVNTAVTSVGTVASGGALTAGIKKSQEEEEIEELIIELCDMGGCDAGAVRTLSVSQKYEVIQKLSEISNLQKEIQVKTNKSKNLGNWRTGLMAGTIGTNLTSAILSGINMNQSDLIQHVSACNEMIKSVSDIDAELKTVGINPNEYPVVKKLSNVHTWCNNIEIQDIEKIEKRMKGVMGTSIAGTVIGAVGVGTSVAANSNHYMDVSNKVKLSEQDKKKENALNTTANVMAGANITTGVVETGLNISLITLSQKLIKQAELCEELL